MLMPSLYITSPGARLEKEAERLCITKDDAVLLAVPVRRVTQVVVVGAASVTTPALNFLLEHNIGLLYLTTSGVYRGRLTADRGKQVEVRRQQYRRADDPEFCLDLARQIVTGKIRNARAFCMRLETSNQDVIVNKVIADLRSIVEQLPSAMTLTELLGHEGIAARRYFAALRRLIRPPWGFSHRARRPPPDPVNALFSLVYTLLHESCYTALEAAGLDPLCGFYHQPRYGRASLALDLVEEFRAIIADSVVLTVLNKRMVTPGQFNRARSGQGIILDHEGWRCVAEQYARRLNTVVRPPGQTRQISYQKVLELQAQQLRRAIMTASVTYKPFLTR